MDRRLFGTALLGSAVVGIGLIWVMHDRWGLVPTWVVIGLTLVAAAAGAGRRGSTADGDRDRALVVAGVTGVLLVLATSLFWAEIGSSWRRDDLGPPTVPEGWAQVFALLDSRTHNGDIAYTEVADAAERAVPGTKVAFRGS